MSRRPAAAPLLREERMAAWRAMRGAPRPTPAPRPETQANPCLTPEVLWFHCRPGQGRAVLSGAGQGRAERSGVMVSGAGKVSRNDHVGSVPKRRAGQDGPRQAGRPGRPPVGAAAAAAAPWVVGGQQLPAGASGLPYRLTLPGSFSRMR